MAYQPPTWPIAENAFSITDWPLSKNDRNVGNKRASAFAKGQPKGVIVHATATRGVKFFTGSTNPWSKRWNASGVTKLPHLILDDATKDPYGNAVSGIFRTLNFNYRGWHAGDDGNEFLLGFEICEPLILTDRKYFDIVYAKAVWLVAKLCKQYGWTVSKKTVMDHSEAHFQGWASNHADVGHWFPKMGASMDGFREDVKELLAYWTPTQPPVTPPVTPTKPPVTPPTTAAYVMYEVVKGDNPTKIAQKFSTTAAAIMVANGIKDATKIGVGTELKIPITAYIVYTYTATDSLYSLGRKYKVDWKKILHDDLKPVNQYDMKKGDVILIPKA